MNHLTQSLITKQLADFRQEQFTGKITVQSHFKVTWYIYLCLGRLVWADGGVHPNRSWYRLISKYCRDFNQYELDLENLDWFESENYCVLNLLLQKRLIAREQAVELVVTKATETIFDLLQTEAEGTLKITSEMASPSSFLVSNSVKLIALINLDDVVTNAQRNWLRWQQKRLQAWSPNLAPTISDRDKLQQEVSPVVYQNFLKLFDGRRTLRDLSFGINKNTAALTSTLIPFVRKGILNLLPAKDINPTQYKIKQNASKATKASSVPAIACIDDSPQIHKIMEQIITSHGYRFISIHESIQAVPTLIKFVPDLIFLDIGMPSVNGYELCSIIKKVSKIKDIPIVILTSNDGIIDRFRAKVVGANGFVTKPINIDTIRDILQKHCVPTSSATTFPPTK